MQDRSWWEGIAHPFFHETKVKRCEMPHLNDVFVALPTPFQTAIYYSEMGNLIVLQNTIIYFIHGYSFLP